MPLKNLVMNANAIVAKVIQQLPCLLLAILSFYIVAVFSMLGMFLLYSIAIIIGAAGLAKYLNYPEAAQKIYQFASVINNLIASYIAIVAGVGVSLALGETAIKGAIFVSNIISSCSFIKPKDSPEKTKIPDHVESASMANIKDKVYQNYINSIGMAFGALSLSCIIIPISFCATALRFFCTAQYKLAPAAGGEENSFYAIRLSLQNIICVMHETHTAIDSRVNLSADASCAKPQENKTPKNAGWESPPKYFFNNISRQGVNESPQNLSSRLILT